MSKFDTQELVEHIDMIGKGLSDWEVQFIANFMDNPPENYTDKQIAVIERIYEQKC